MCCWVSKYLAIFPLLLFSWILFAIGVLCEFSLSDLLRYASWHRRWAALGNVPRMPGQEVCSAVEACECEPDSGHVTCGTRGRMVHSLPATWRGAPSPAFFLSAPQLFAPQVRRHCSMRSVQVQLHVPGEEAQATLVTLCWIPGDSLSVLPFRSSCP